MSGRRGSGSEARLGRPGCNTEPCPVTATTETEQNGPDDAPEDPDCRLPDPAVWRASRVWPRTGRFHPGCMSTTASISNYEFDQRVLFLKAVNSPGDIEKQAMTAPDRRPAACRRGKEIGIKLTEEQIKDGMERIRRPGQPDIRAVPGRLLAKRASMPRRSAISLRRTSCGAKSSGPSTDPWPRSPTPIVDLALVTGFAAWRLCAS